MSVTALPFNNSISPPATTVTWPRTLLWVTPLLTATLFSKFAVPPLGAQGIGIALPILLMVTLMGCMMHQFVIATQRFMFGALTLAYLGLVQLLKNDVFYPSSLLLLAALHFPLMLQFRIAIQDINKVCKFFLWICCLCACLALAQFLLQSVVENRWLYPIENFVPEAFRTLNFNDQALLEYNSTTVRANGVFMLEPSYLSQLLAVGIVIELVTFNKVWRLLLFMAAMLASFSGTGFMVLAVCIPAVIISQRRWGLFAALFIAALFAGVLLQYVGGGLYFDKFIARLGEFNSTGSSGFARFVGGFYLFDQFLSEHPLRFLFGVGAGTFKDYAPLAHYPVAEMPLFKMVMEFGIGGALLYFSFLFYCLSSSALPVPAVLAIALTFLLNGLYVPFSHALALSLLVWTSVAQPRSSKETESPRSLNHVGKAIGLPRALEAQ